MFGEEEVCAAGGSAGGLGGIQGRVRQSDGADACIQLQERGFYQQGPEEGDHVHDRGILRVRRDIEEKLFQALREKRALCRDYADDARGVRGGRAGEIRIGVDTNAVIGALDEPLRVFDEAE